SPRAPALGYAWRDTLAHELTHLALSRGTLDRAPLWLQEGVAKREETRWRSALPSDDAVPADLIASIGLAKNLGRPLDGIGPSIATRKGKLPPAVGLDDPKSKEAAKLEAKSELEAHRAFRLGHLLLARDHIKEARKKVDPLAAGHVGDPLLNALIARARLADG